jgi:hypothetical protein
MNASEFLERLISSYPAGLRPDEDYTRVLDRDFKRRGLSSAEWEAAYDIAKDNFRMFPTMMDFNYCFSEAHSKVYKGSAPKIAYEYFRIDDKPFRRKVEIAPDGSLARLELPENATDYHLFLPDELEEDKNFLTAAQAVAAGYIPGGLYQTMTANRPNPVKSRFSKIGDLVRKEGEQKHNPIHAPVAEADDVDDSMASNPETEPTWDDI